MELMAVLFNSQSTLLCESLYKKYDYTIVFERRRII